jgi:outer membrane protein assembly factor BamB
MHKGRRRSIALALLLPFTFCLLPSAALPQSATPATNWYQFRGNQQLTGLSGMMGTPTALRHLWTYEAGESIESSAAVVGGTVFAGSHKGELVALSLENGAVYWKYGTGAEIGESSPFYNGQDDLVYVGDLGGVLHAVGARDGRPAWTFKTGGEIKSSPVAVGNRLLIGSYDQHLYCLNAKTGALLWKFKTNGPVHATPAVVNGIAYIAGCDEMFRAIRVSDGRELFQVASGAYTGASPALAAGFAFYGTFNNDVLAVNLRTRRVGWRYQPQERQFPFYSSAAVSQGRVVVGGRDKLVHCISAVNGKSLWTFSTRARVESSPAIAGGRVYVGSNDGRFYVLDLQSGAKVWEFNAGAPLSASPGLGSGRIVIGAQDGRLYCFG